MRQEKWHDSSMAQQGMVVWLCDMEDKKIIWSSLFYIYHEWDN